MEKGIQQKLNGYQYAYDTPVTCEMCFIQPKEGGQGKQYRLFEANGKKVCRECAKEKKIL